MAKIRCTNKLLLSEVRQQLKVCRTGLATTKPGKVWDTFDACVGGAEAAYKHILAGNCKRALSELLAASYAEGRAHGLEGDD